MNLKSRNKVSADFSMASMTDIVFLLLIFFMLTSSVVSESALDIVLPKSEGKQTENETTVVEISANGTYALDGIILDDKSQLASRLAEKFELEEKPSFILKADEKSIHDDFIYALSIAHKKRYRVVVATQPSN